MRTEYRYRAWPPLAIIPRARDSKSSIVLVAMSLREFILFDNVRLFGKVVPLGDDFLKEELPRTFLRYLGVKGE